MAIDLSQVITDLRGRPMKDIMAGKHAAESPDLTLGTACSNALVQVYEDERELRGVEKVRRFALAMKLAGADEVDDLTAEDIALLKTMIDKCYGTIVVGRAWPMLDPASVNSAGKGRRTK